MQPIGPRTPKNDPFIDGFLALVHETHELIDGGDIIRFSQSIDPDPYTAMRIVRESFEWLMDGMGAQSARYRYADDREMWSVLSTLGANPTINPVVLSVLAHEDYTDGASYYVVANPSTPDFVIDVYFNPYRFRATMTDQSEVVAGLLDRPNLTDAHMSALVNEIASGKPFGLDLGHEEWHYPGDVGFDGIPMVSFGAATSQMLSPEWRHYHRLTDQQKSSLLVTAATK